MSTYIIDYSDPLRDGFTIAPGGFNGPGGALVESSLRLYGRGALEWGEAVNENMLRTLENWNSATPTPYPVGGQLWFQTKFFWLHTATNWYVLDPNSPTVWSTFVPSGGVAGTNTTPPLVIGAYWYTGGAPTGTDAFGEPIQPLTLYVYDAAFAQVAPGWMQRTHSINALAPVNGVDFPETSLNVRNEFTGAWVGLLIADGSVAFTGDLDMGTNRIINLANPVNPGDALSLGYADSRYINVTGDTMTGFLLLNANPVAALGAATKQYVDTSISGAGAAFVLKVGDTMTGNLTMSGAGVQVVLPNEPTIGTHASNRTYVNKGLRPAASVGTPTTPQYHFSTIAPTAPDGADGDVWFQYVP